MRLLNGRVFSKTTVSFYLNGKINKMSEETKQRIQHIIDETGYEPSAAARAMKAKSSGVVGVILADTSEGYCARALKGIEEAASALEYQIVVGNSGLAFQHEKDYVERMLRLGVDGFIVQSTYRFGMLASDLEKRKSPSYTWMPSPMILRDGMLKVTIMTAYTR